MRSARDREEEVEVAEVANFIFKKISRNWQVPQVPNS